MNTSTLRVDGLLFDKDGTLFDFRATWNVWSAQLIRDFISHRPSPDTANQLGLKIGWHDALPLNFSDRT